MYCPKERKRTLYNIFDVVSCDRCKNYRDDEIILIGNNIIRVLPILKGCKRVKDDLISECFSERLVRMLKEVEAYLECNDDYVFLWSNDGESDFIYNLDLFESFLNQGLNICIIY